jgi:hypothetical protein
MVTTAAGLVYMPVPALGVLYTNSFKISGGQAFGVWVRATSDIGTPDIKIELEQSYVQPDIEGLADSNLFVEPDEYPDVFAQINDDIAHIKAVTPVGMPFARYRITGQGNNPADTIVRIVNFIQEMA